MDYIEKCLEKWGNLYRYISFRRNCCRIKILYECDLHGIREQTFDSLIKSGCYRCYKTSTLESFIKSATIIHNGKYSYKNSKYISSSNLIEIICEKHGSFWQSPNNHLSKKNGCSYCANVRIKNNSDFVLFCSERFKYKYNYDKVNFANRYDKVIITCPKHGDFEQVASYHISGSGCIKCKYNILTTDIFIGRSSLIHSGLYDYSKSVYINGLTKIEIICKEHGSFWQRPSNHMYKKYGCPNCFNKTSKMELEWLDSMNISNLYRQFKIDGYIVDGFDVSTNTIYEFYGDYWHGNPIKYNPDKVNELNKISFGELYQRTMDREKYLISKGYNVISMWESNFKNNKIK